MKRVWIFVGTGILLLLLFGLWYSQREWLTDLLLAEIYYGMEEDEVEALLGKPEKGYVLTSYYDLDTLWINGDKPSVTLVAPDNPWLATLNTHGPAIRQFGGLIGRCPTIEPPPSIKHSEEWVWVSNKRVVILGVDDRRGVTCLRAYSVTKSGGGFFSWLSRKWDDWMQGK